VESLPVTVIYTLASSLLLALSLTPYLASIFLKKKKPNSASPKGIKKILHGLIDGPYQRTLQWALKHAWWVVVISLILFSGASGLFFQIGVSFFPKAEKPQFMIRVNAPESTNIDNVNTIARYVESVLDTIPAVEKYATNVGHGNPRIYYNIFPRYFTKNFAEIFVELKEYNVDEFDGLVTHLRHFFSNNPSARIEIKEFEQGVPIEAPLTIKITGENVKILEKLADDVETIVRNTDGVLNIDNQLKRRGTDIYFNINREKAGMLGVPISEIDKTIRTAVAGSAIAKFRDTEGEEYDIVLRLPIEDKVKLEDFDKIHVQSLSGAQIPLKTLASMEFRQAPGIISHYNHSRAATITGDIQKGYFLDDVIASIEEELVQYTWPRGYNYKFTGELESRQESFGGMFNASIIALIAIFAVLVLQFRSFSQPLIIYSAIPLAVIGSTLALFLTGYSFSFTAFIGLISLIGIVVNNSIILVDYTNQLLKEGHAPNQALTIAGQTRFTPIVLTTLTTIGGLLPLTLQGGTLWAPMGWTIIGGLLVSTFLTLIVVPVLYKILTPGKKLKTSGLGK
jgi:multidrug efflux pump subunit AcrB